MISLRWPKTSSGAAAVAALLVFTGCDRGRVQSYSAPKEAPPAPGRMTAAPLGMGQPPEIGTPSVKWKLPSGWQELPPSQMRVGFFAIAGPDGQKAQMTIIPLGGMGGGDLENVNRWRGQVGLGRIEQAEMERLSETVKIGSADGRLFDFAGKTPDDDKPARLIAAMLPRDGTAWFFKLMGDDALVAAQKPVLVEFLKSIAFGAPSSDAAMVAEGTLPEGHPPVPSVASPGAGLPDGHPPITPPSAPAEPAASTPTVAPAGLASGSSEWKLPGGWKQLAPGTFQKARFLAAESGAGKAEATISVLGGSGGGDLANVNRWRGQLGLKPISESELAGLASAVEAEGRPAKLVDMTAASGQQRIVAVIAARETETVFYRLSGNPDLVGAQKETFLGFVKSPR